MLHTLLTVLHGLAAFAAFSCWVGAMYCWWVVNNSLQPGKSKLSLLSPMSYFELWRFTPRGIAYRHKVMGLFAATLVFAIIAWLLRRLLETYE